MPHSPLSSPPGGATSALLPDVPEITLGADFVVIGTFDSAIEARIGDPDMHDRPLLRIYVDDVLIRDVSGPASLPDMSDGGMATTAGQARTSSGAGNGDAA